jgi:hypothetical protein
VIATPIIGLGHNAKDVSLARLSEKVVGKPLKESGFVSEDHP